MFTYNSIRLKHFVLSAVHTRSVWLSSQLNGPLEKGSHRSV